MNFTINTQELKKGLKTTISVVKKNPTLPILGGILFEFTKVGGTTNILNITGTDLETTIVYNLNFITDDTIDNFIITDPFKLLQFLNTQKDIVDINFKLNKEKHSLKIKADKDTITIPVSTDTVEFPSIDDDITYSKINFDYKELYNTLNKASKFTDNDELRPVMNGVLLDLHDEEIYAVATDAHKLCKLKFDKYESKLTDNKVILNNSFIKNLPNNSNIEDAELYVSNTSIYITVGNTMIFSRLIIGDYPAYNSVIPEHPFSTDINVKELLELVTKASLFSNIASNLVKMELTEKKIKVSAQDIDFSYSFESEIDFKGCDKPLTIGFKDSFFIEIFNAIKNEEEITLKYNDPSRAMIFTNEDNTELFLLMPMML